MTQALNTFYCRGVLGTRVNADTIGYVWNGEFEFEYAVEMVVQNVTTVTDGDFS